MPSDEADNLSPDQIEQGRLLFSGDCDFVLGVAGLEQLPSDSVPEIAFAGRSNVGKSSLVNALTGRKTLARTSNTPGRTQQLNFFNLGNRLTMVDMPGYGYAKVSKKQRAEWDKLIFNYLRGRANLRCVFILIDSRHGVKESDEKLMTMLDNAAVSYRIILTKVDKTKPSALADIHQSIKAVLKKHPAAYPYLIDTSTIKDIGIAEFRAVLTQMANPA